MLPKGGNGPNSDIGPIVIPHCSGLWCRRLCYCWGSQHRPGRQHTACIGKAGNDRVIAPFLHWPAIFRQKTSAVNQKDRPSNCRVTRRRPSVAALSGARPTCAYAKPNKRADTIEPGATRPRWRTPRSRLTVCCACRPSRCLCRRSAGCSSQGRCGVRGEATCATAILGHNLIQLPTDRLRRRLLGKRGYRHF